MDWDRDDFFGGIWSQSQAHAGPVGQEAEDRAHRPLGHRIDDLRASGGGEGKRSLGGGISCQGALRPTLLAAPKVPPGTHVGFLPGVDLIATTGAYLDTLRLSAWKTGLPKRTYQDV